MHPAFSVIFLTTLIGVGQGLFLALATVEFYSAFDLLPKQDGDFHALGGQFAFLLLVAGLVASFFHLGHPERAWRAATRWRTSWLSREVIVLPAFMAMVALYALAQHYGWREPRFVIAGNLVLDPVRVFAVAGIVLAFALYFCTAMIYASLSFIREWATPLTPLNYVLLGGSMGFSMAAMMAAGCQPGLLRFYGGWALVLTFLAVVVRVVSLLRNARLAPKSTLATAIGVRHSSIVQKSQGAIAGSFNTREFFHGRTPAFVTRVRNGFLLAWGLSFLLLLGVFFGGREALVAPAFLLQTLGILAERWLFFAEARHPQNLYYQTVS
jgi:DMSO reductase anchor subunit